MSNNPSDGRSAKGDSRDVAAGTGGGAAKWTRSGDEVTIRMSIGDWENLLMMLGQAIGGQQRNSLNRDENEDQRSRNFYRSIALVNRLNQGNPHFQPYAIPPEFADSPLESTDAGVAPAPEAQTVRQKKA